MHNGHADSEAARLAAMADWLVRKSTAGSIM
jgi:hypothetical protein